MKRYRFVHAADLHLDSPLRGLLQEMSPLTARLNDVTFDAYEAIITLCIERHVDALLVAGDIYDSADRSLGAQLRFIDGLRRLEAAGIRAFICHGNHDPLDGWEARIPFPSNVVRFGPDVTFEKIDPLDAQSPLVYGVSYPTREMRESLVARFPKPQPGHYCIGLMHANVGVNTGHEAYAACSLGELAESGYDYWALGHVHTANVLRDRNPTVIYPGNPQGRHINEPGPRGVYLVEVDEQHVTTFDFLTLDAVRWERVDIDIQPIYSEQALLEAVEQSIEEARSAASGRPLVYRLCFVGRSPVHEALVRPSFTQDIRTHLNDRFALHPEFAWCESVEDQSSPEIDREALRQSTDLIGDLLRLIDHMREDIAEEIEALRTELSVLYGHSRARRYLSDQALEAPAIETLLNDAERLLLNDLLDARTE